MSLSLINSTGNTQTAQGQLVSVSLTLKSAEILTGKVIRVNPALWISNSSVPSNVSWQINYPTSTPVGGIPMTYVGLAVNENYSLNIEVIDAYRFKLIYCYFNLSNLNDYLNDSSYNNSQVLLPTSVSNKDLSFHIVNVNDNDSIDVNINSTVNGFSNDLSIDVTGFNPNSDLCVNLSSSQLNISNQWYVGFVDVTNTTSVLPFADDLTLNYGSVSNGVSLVKDLPISVYNGGNGFIWNGTQSTAQIKVKAAELDANKTYRLYAVYQEDGVWKSYISPELNALSSDREQILGTVSTEVTDTFGNVHASGCISNMSPCGQITICATLDIASFDANLVAAGLTGTFEDYYQSGGVYVGDGEPVEGFLGQLLRSTEDLTATELTLCTVINDDFLNGQKYYTFSIKTTIGGVDDYINVVVPIFYSKSIEVSPVINLDSDLVDRICVEESDYVLTNVDENCNNIASVNGGTFQGSTVLDGNTIDPSGLEEGDVVCLKVSCEGNVEMEQCICPACEDVLVNLTITEGFQVGGFTPYTINVDVLGLNVTTMTFTDTHGTVTVGGPSLAINFAENENPLVNTFDLTFTTDDGCNYSYSDIYPQDPSLQGFVQYNIPGVGTIDCDCEEINPAPLVCENNAWFTAECDNETGSIVVTSDQSFASPVDTDVVSNLTGNTELTVIREITFTDGCDPISITQVFTCEKIKSCDNSLSIEYTEVDGLITLTENEGFNSGIASDTGLEYSIDSGVTYLSYSNPVQLANGETIIWSRSVIFDDGCDNVIDAGNFTYTEEIDEPTTAECENAYSGYDISLTIDDTNSTFTVIKSGNETDLTINELLWNGLSVDPFGANGSGLPYMGAVTMRGQFIAAWKIKVANCPEKIIYKNGYLKPEVKVCELPPIVWSPDNDTLGVCIKDCPPCGCIFDVACTNCEATIINLTDCAGFTFEWFDPNGDPIGLGVGPITLTIEGDYLIKASGANCVENFTYTHDTPEAGTPNSNPIILQ